MNLSMRERTRNLESELVAGGIRHCCKFPNPAPSQSSVVRYATGLKREWVPAQMSSSSFDRGSKSRGPQTNSPRKAL
ncbi:hypothetical protein TNCV_3192401 [Trichonephila clavipes]|nr:hypothetical protein TNCV_3192401 [Trichonephila clavipes]